MSARTLDRYTQNLTVTIGKMNTTQVIAAGYAASSPAHLTTVPQPGDSAGTWATATPLGPGDTYTASVYAPHPSAALLRKAGANYPVDIARSDLALTMPQNPPSDGVAPQTVLFPTFRSHVAPEDQTNPTSFTGTAAIRSSPYWQVYALAESLAREAKTPYAFVQRVMSYLSPANGFSYNEFPPLTRYPLATFLLVNKLGYCQQFAGSMALMLRMGGVPARVATGFTTGTYDQATKRWLVTDVDAHAWVEAWFPHYGWVTFDPTPAAAPARGGRAPISSSGNLLGSGQFPNSVRRADTAAGASRRGLRGARHELGRHRPPGDARRARRAARGRVPSLASDRAARARRTAGRARAGARAQRTPDLRRGHARGGRAPLPHVARGRGIRAQAARRPLRRRVRDADARAAASPARSAPGRARSRWCHTRAVGAAAASAPRARAFGATRTVLRVRG